MGVGVGVVIGVVVGEALGAAPIVPDGALPRATYPNRPDDALPQSSNG